MAVFPKQQGYDQQRNDGERNQQSDFPLRGRIRKNTERGARVFGVDNAKKSRNDGNAVVQGKPVRDRPLGGADESDDEQRDQKMIFAHDPKNFLVFWLLTLAPPSRPPRRGRDALGTAGKMPALHPCTSLSRLRKGAVTPLQFL